MTHVAYQGENIGNDWSFYLHTGAGLVRLSSKLAHGRDDGRAQVIGVRGVSPAPAAPATAVRFERELWWVTAIERDIGRDDHGISMLMPVVVPLEPGVRVQRVLDVDVRESRRRGRVAKLRFDLQAQVERGDQPAVQLDGTLIPAVEPSPWATAGRLPDRFTAEVEGLDGSTMPVTGERRILTDRNYAGDDPCSEAFVDFLVRHSGDFMPRWFTPQIALYELRNPNGRRFWAGEDSTPSRRNHQKIVDGFATASPIPAGLGAARQLRPTVSFEPRSSMLDSLLMPKLAGEVAQSASTIAELIAALTARHPEYAPVARRLYVRTVAMDEHSGELTRVMFIDPTPFAGPDMALWMIAWTDAWYA
jgi:hypothetical protein